MVMVLNRLAPGFYSNHFLSKWLVVLTEGAAARATTSRRLNVLSKNKPDWTSPSVQKCPVKLGLGQTVLPGKPQGAKFLVVWGRRGRGRRWRLAGLRWQAVHLHLIVLQLCGHLQGPLVERLGGAVGAGVHVICALAPGCHVALPVFGAP